MADNQKLFTLVEKIVANYRDGQGAAGLFVHLHELSAEWERRGLPCTVRKHGRRDRIREAVESGKIVFFAD